MAKSDYESKRRALHQLLGSAAADLDATDSNIRDFREYSEDALLLTDESKELVFKFQQLAGALPSGTKCEPSQEVQELLDSGVDMAGTLAAHSSYMKGQSRDLATAGEQFLWTARINRATSASTSPVISSIGDTLGGEYPSVRAAVEKLGLPTRADRRDDVAAWFTKLGDSLLMEKHSEAHACLLGGKYMSAAHAMREALSHLLDLLAPTEAVQSRPWFKGVSASGPPTQPERVKYAVLGTSPDGAVPEENLTALAELMREAREIYKQLSGEAHRRKGEWARLRTEQYFGIAEQVILQIRDLRQRFFVDE